MNFHNQYIAADQIDHPDYFTLNIISRNHSNVYLHIYIPRFYDIYRLYFYIYI